MKQEIENKVKDCTACLASGKNLKYQLPKNYYGKLEKLSDGQEIQIDFYGKLRNKNLHGEVQILMQNLRSKSGYQFLPSNFRLCGIPEKIESDKEERSFRRNINNSARAENLK